MPALGTIRDVPMCCHSITAGRGCNKKAPIGSVSGLVAAVHRGEVRPLPSPSEQASRVRVREVAWDISGQQEIGDGDQGIVVRVA